MVLHNRMRSYRVFRHFRRVFFIHPLHYHSSNCDGTLISRSYCSDFIINPSVFSWQYRRANGQRREKILSERNHFRCYLGALSLNTPFHYRSFGPFLNYVPRIRGTARTGSEKPVCPGFIWKEVLFVALPPRYKNSHYRNEKRHCHANAPHLPVYFALIKNCRHFVTPAPLRRTLLTIALRCSSRYRLQDEFGQRKQNGLDLGEAPLKCKSGKLCGNEGAAVSLHQGCNKLYKKYFQRCFYSLDYRCPILLMCF